MSLVVIQVFSVRSELMNVSLRRAKG